MGATFVVHSEPVYPLAIALITIVAVSVITRVLVARDSSVVARRPLTTPSTLEEPGQPPDSGAAAGLRRGRAVWDGWREAA